MMLRLYASEEAQNSGFAAGGAVAYDPLKDLAKGGDQGAFVW